MLPFRNDRSQSSKSTWRFGSTKIQAVLLFGLGVAVLALSATAAALSRRGFESSRTSLVLDSDRSFDAASEQTTADPTPNADQDLDQGRQIRKGRLVYQVHCVRCHGLEGRGDGPSAFALDPAPGDLSGSWRTAKNPESVRRTIVEGIPGTAMAGIGRSLSSRELEALTAFVLDLSSPSDKIQTRSALDPNDPWPAWSAAGFQREPTLRQAPPLEVIGASRNDPRRLDDLRGRWVLIHFWGTSCGHCLEELPALGRFIKQLGEKGPAVLNLCIDTEDPAEAARIAQSRFPGLEVFVDPSGLAALRYGVNLLPATVLIDPDGQLVARRLGELDWSSIPVSALLESGEASQVRADAP